MVINEFGSGTNAFAPLAASEFQHLTEEALYNQTIAKRIDGSFAEVINRQNWPTSFFFVDSTLSGPTVETYSISSYNCNQLM